jgi:molybdopterin-guanine dinucleotide biosynthesis protein B
VAARRRRALTASSRTPPILAVSGPSGAGKTRLLSRLIPALARRGISVAAVKSTRHAHPFDRPGKDTDVLRRAGAIAAVIEGPHALALFAPPAGGLRALARLVPPVDLVLAEGFRREPVPRVEVHRRAVSRAFLCARDPRVFAVVTDEPPPRAVRAFTDGEVEPLAELVCVRLRLGGKPRRRRRLRGRPTVSSLRAEGSGRKVAHGRTERMAKTTTTRKGGSRRGGTRSKTSRSSSARKGGMATLRARGAEFFSEIGRKGAKSRAKARRGAAPRSTGGRARRTGSRARAGARTKSR